MTRSRCSPHLQPRTSIAVVRTFGQPLSAIVGFLLIVTGVMLIPSLTLAETAPSPVLLADVVRQQAEALALIDSDDNALKLFTTTVGPALGLKDAAGALAAKRLPSKLVKELGLAELAQSVHELMAALATWQLAESLRRDTSPTSTHPAISAARLDWMQNRSRTTSRSDLLRLARET